MRETENYGLHLMESGDLMSARPLNENAEKVDSALSAAAAATAGKAMIATGRYTGTGTRSVTIETPGFRPRIVMMRSADGPISESTSGVPNGMLVKNGWALWIGADIPARYRLGLRNEEGYIDTFEAIDTTVQFTPSAGSLAWEIPMYPDSYTNVGADYGPVVVNNGNGQIYEWIALGMAE